MAVTHLVPAGASGVQPRDPSTGRVAVPDVRGRLMASPATPAAGAQVAGAGGVDGVPPAACVPAPPSELQSP